jgi:hypothetical protein
MKQSANSKPFYGLSFYPKIFLTYFLLTSSFLMSTSCGSGDAKLQVKNFCDNVKIGEPVMNVFARAGKVEFDKYWLEKFDKDPSKGEVIGIVRSRDFEKKTEKLSKLKDPKTWNHGQFKAMIQELGYSRHICSVDFSKSKVLKKEVLSVD